MRGMLISGFGILVAIKAPVGAWAEDNIVVLVYYQVMQESVLKIDSVVIYWYSVVLVLAFLWGSFVAHKKLSEANFEDLQILDLAVMTGFWSFIFGRLAFVLLHIGVFWNNWPRVLFLKNYPGLDHWGLLLGIVLSVYIMNKKTKQRFFDWFDFAMLGVVAAMPVYFAGLVLSNFSWLSVGGALVSLVVFVFLWRAEMSYRTYEWYRNKRTQARSGFIGGTALSFYGLTHLTLQFFSLDKNIVSIMANFLLFVGGWVMVYSRSGRNLPDDLKFITRHGKK